MTSFSQMNVGEAIGTVRDLAFVGGVLVFGFKVRAWIQPVIDFFERANTFFDTSQSHMRVMENGMQTLLGNHLHHIQADLGHISGRETRHAVVVAEAVTDKPSDTAEA